MWRPCVSIDVGCPLRPFFPFVALHCWACLLFWGFAPLSLFVCLCVHRCLSSFCLPFNPFICLSAWLRCLWLCLGLSFVTFYLAGLLSVFASFGLCLLSPFASSLSPGIWLHLVGWARGFCSIISAADNGFASQYHIVAARVGVGKWVVIWWVVIYERVSTPSFQEPFAAHAETNRLEPSENTHRAKASSLDVQKHFFGIRDKNSSLWTRARTGAHLDGSSLHGMPRLVSKEQDQLQGLRWWKMLVRHRYTIISAMQRRFSAELGRNQAPLART